jgi:amino acid transporter
MKNPFKNSTEKKPGFGTAPVFFTAISTILGAILFLRFGYATGELGFWGVMLILLLGHMVTIPTALAISEISTNQRVEGGGEYFIISRSFGLNIGATIGIALFLSQAISVAFYVIAFTEAFEPFFNWVSTKYNLNLPRQAISIPAMALLSLLILKKGANLGVKALYLVVAILFISLVCFFIGKTDYEMTTHTVLFSNSLKNLDNFFFVFAIIFPAFTGITAGVGLSGDLRNPGKSIPVGTIAATFAGMIMYVFIVWKLVISASPEDLSEHQLIMGKIALYGPIIIPLGLAASTISSAIGSIMVAPRTLQALGGDNSFPFKNFNSYIAKGKANTNEPFNASLITCIIAFIFVALGNVNAVAEIISMFFMVTYGSLCLISFLNHFGADPSYRPRFRSKWTLSLMGFIVSVWLMFKINWIYAILAIVMMIVLYFVINRVHRDRQGLETIFRSAIYQINRNLQVYLQKQKELKKKLPWRPSAICISKRSFDRENAFNLLNWISHKYGFGTYIHLIEGYFSSSSERKAKEMLKILIEKSEYKHSNIYIDTLVSPSYTSAIAQIIQLPGISGMENNMVILEFDRSDPSNLGQIIENIPLIRAGKNDVCILSSSKKPVKYKNGIHIWIRSVDILNANLMILLSYIILGHPDWQKGSIKIFDVCKKEEVEETREKLVNLIEEGRLPISQKNIEIIEADINLNIKDVIKSHSIDAGLTLVGFRAERMKHDGKAFLEGYDEMGDILFVNSHRQKEIT